MARALPMCTENEEGETFSSWEAVLKLPFKVKIEDEEGEMWFAFPYTTVLQKIEEQMRGAGGDEQAHPVLAEQVEGSSLTLSLSLGEANLSFQELLKLEKGDIIRLGSRPKEKCSLAIGKQLELRGNIGTYRGKYAFRVDKIQHREIG